MSQVLESQFISGAYSLSQLPEVHAPEVAFIGRSNVGKSSLINRLTGRKNLAHTSQTPGKTTELNLFSLRVGLDEGEREMFLVDLPGYGYAKTSKGKRERLSRLTVDYIVQRESLTLMCLLQDSKRTPGEEELQLRQLAYDAGVPVQVIVTKIDRLNQKDKHAQVKAIAAKYSLEVEDLVLCGNNTPPHHVWKRLFPYCF